VISCTPEFELEVGVLLEKLYENKDVIFLKKKKTKTKNKNKQAKKKQLCLSSLGNIFLKVTREVL